MLLGTFAKLNNKIKNINISSRHITHCWVCQSALYADIGNDDDIYLPCGRLPGVTSRVLIAGVESTPQGSLLCYFKIGNKFGVGRDRTRVPRFATRHSIILLRKVL